MIQKRKISFQESVQLVYGYAKTRILEQAKSIAFIILYLVLFQLLVLRVPLANALETSGGLVFVIFGLAFFLEGLILGLMPIGERVGVKLPLKVGILVISAFGFILGFGATFAEPAISALKMAGSTITAWDSPLLFMILEHHSDLLVYSVGVGVGFAVALGMCRFYFNWSIKPFIYVTIPILLLLSLYSASDPNLNKIIGLAWDCGAVTTGAVTVPLVLALGIGVSRASQKGGGAGGGGFGIILLASAFPILAVLILGTFLNINAPRPTTEEIFFSAEGKELADRVFLDNDELEWHLFTHGTEKGRMAHFGSYEEYETALKNLENDVDMRQKYLRDMSLTEWIIRHASENERHILVEASLVQTSAPMLSEAAKVLQQEGKAGFQAVLPLTVLLLLVLLLLREKIRHKDEIVLGIAFTLIGMILLTSGIRLGLGSLGTEVGTHIPKAFANEEKFIGRVVIHDFDSSYLYKAVAEDGTSKTFFNVYDHKFDHDEMRPIEYLPKLHDVKESRYTHMITEKPLFNKRYATMGFILVLVFSFGMGYGATLAEPALNALGMTVETLTVGTLKRTKIVQVVSVGVGLGILLGVSRILFDLPLIWMIVPSYVLLLILTFFSEEEFTAIAWDSGGVTTGPVTVPLVLAMGLGIGGELHISDGFGILAMASTFPIITVLLYGLYSKYTQAKTLNQEEDER